MNDTQTRILGIVDALDRPGKDAVINYLLNSSYFVRGCYGHHKERGGLAAHCLEVYDYMTANAQGFPADSLAVVAIFHDLGKTRHSDGRGHGQRSLDILDQCGFPLTADERTAIGLHHIRCATSKACALRRALTSGDCDSTGRWKRAHQIH